MWPACITYLLTYVLSDQVIKVSKERVDTVGRHPSNQLNPSYRMLLALNQAPPSGWMDGQHPSQQQASKHPCFLPSLESLPACLAGKRALRRRPLCTRRAPEPANVRRAIGKDYRPAWVGVIRVGIRVGLKSERRRAAIDASERIRGRNKHGRRRLQAKPRKKEGRRVEREDVNGASIT